jgi:hypothetical protein
VKKQVSATAIQAIRRIVDAFLSRQVQSHGSSLSVARKTEPRWATRHAGGR